MGKFPRLYRARSNNFLFRINKKLHEKDENHFAICGKTDNKQFAQLLDEYRKRVNFYIPFETQIVPDIKNRKNISEKEQKTLEGNLLFKSLLSTDYVVLLDDKGKQFSSVEFAGYLEKKATPYPKDWYL